VTPEEAMAEMWEQAEQADAKAKRAVQRAAEFYASKVKRDAPWDTGDYRRSIGVEDVTGVSGTAAFSVGTNKVQGPTLEFGDQGVDRLGRRRNHRPQPHFGPNEKHFHKRLEIEIDDMFGW
jgi:hypothetical protein